MAEEKKPTGLKISVVGPSGAGKSTIANFLAADSDRAQFKLASAYVPTVGVRILECERAVGGPASAVELWDAGGSTDYESCWPAIMKDTAGVILVYNPDNEGHVSESGAWYDYFVKNNELPDEACVVFAFDPNARRGARQRTSPKLQHLNVINASLEDGPFLLQQFDRFLRAVKHQRDGAGEDK